MKLFALICCLFISSSACLATTIDCLGNTSLDTTEAIANLSLQCRKISGKNSRTRFINRKFNEMKKIRTLLSAPAWKTMKKGKNKLIRQNCPEFTATNSNCSSAKLISEQLILDQIPSMACTQIYSEERRDALRMIKKSFSKLEVVFGASIQAQVLQTIETLKKSESCGQGGSDLLKYCNGIYETADGIGKNVYKLLEYAPHLPIFVTRDDAQVCTARRISGTVIERLRYTGLANPDSAGLRHHYRFSRTCSNLPKLFYIECAGRCYEIDDRCGRID